MAFSRRELSIPAELSRLPQARAFAQECARDYGFADNVAFLIKSAMSEAVANAIEHGSNGPQDEVTIEALDEGGSLVFYVTDRGRFRPRVERQGELSERGRGMQFLGQMMDEVDVRPGRRGTVVRMAKRR